MGKILGICISEKRGTEKHEIQEANLVKDWGIEGDAHGGKWHRQVSLLSFEKIEDFRAKGAEVDFGAFGENLIVEGYDLRALPVGTRFQVGDAVLELTRSARNVIVIVRSINGWVTLYAEGRRIYRSDRAWTYQNWR